MANIEVGLPTSATAECAYSRDLDTPACGEDATVHVAVRSAVWGVVSLASCGQHAPIARLTGELLGEHAYQPVCLVADCWEGVV